MKDKFRESFEKSPIGILFLDKEGKLTDANQSTLKILGFLSLNDVAGRNILNDVNIAPKKDELLEKGHIKIQAYYNFDNIKKLGYYNPTRSGTAFIDLTISVIDSGFLAQIQDITEQKKAEEELKKSEARFRSVLDNSLDAIYRVNLNTGRYEYFSPAFEHIVGRPAEEYMSQTPEQAMSLIHPDDLQLAKEALSRLDKTGNVKAEYRVRDNSGNYRYLSNHITLVMDKSGQPLYRDGTIRNITKQKKAEEGLRENEEKLRTLFETMPIGISILDKDRNVIYENHALENILELTKEDLSKGGYAKRKYVHSDMTEISLDELPSAKAFYEKKPVENVEVGVIKENNSIIWTNVSAIPLSFSDWKVLVVTSNITESKKAEQESNRLISELDEQRNLLDTIIEQLPVGVGIAEAPSGELIRINEQTRRIWMYDQMEADDMAGYGKYAGFHPDGRKYRSEDWQLVRALKGEVIQGEELEFIRGDETRRFMRSNAAPVKDKAGNIKAAIVVIEDITEHKKAEEELIESKNKLESVIESITDAVFVSDVDGNFVNFNEAFATYHKFKDKEEAYKTLSEYPDYIDVYFADGTLAPLDMWAVPRALRGEIAFNDVYRLRRKDTGEEWWGSYSFAPIKDKDNKIIGSVVVGRDITEQKQIEKELRQAHDNLEEQVEVRTTELEEAYQSLKESELKAKERADLLEVTHEAIFVRDMNDKITFWNNGAEELYGWTKKEVLGKITHDLLRTEFSEPLEQIKIDVLSKGRWDGELIQERIDGTKINILSRWSLQRDKKNKPIGFLELNTDITDLKQTEEQLKEIIGELERSNKELQSFAYITSHDLQEPLRTMGNYAGLLKKRYEGQLDEDADDFLDYMASGAARMKDMVQGLLDYSRVGTKGGEFKEFNAEEALDTALTNLKSPIEEFHAEVTHESLPVIFADESQITRVFQNLIGNALKFHKEGVTPKIHVSAVKTDNEYIFSVQDNGMGIEPQYTDRIFEVFKRLHPIGEYQGAGIGLAIVKRIIERHGGRVWVESKFDVGSTFYFTIPIKNE